MNEQFKGTPGPWEWKESVNIRGYYFLANENETKSNSIVDDGSACGEYSPTIDVHDADANLIAAAPDLLEALQACLPWVNSGLSRGVHAKAHAAINKALGKGTDK